MSARSGPNSCLDINSECLGNNLLGAADDPSKKDAYID